MRPQKRKRNEDSCGPSNKKRMRIKLDLSIPTKAKKRNRNKSLCKPQKRKQNKDSSGRSNKRRRWKKIDLSIPTGPKKTNHNKSLEVCNHSQSEETQLSKKEKLALFSKNYRRKGLVNQDSSQFATPRVERIRAALEGLSSGKYSTISEAASANGVHYDQIQRRARGNVKWYRRNGPEPFLTLGEERHLARWVVTMGSRGFTVAPKQVKDTVQQMIKQSRRKTSFRNGRPSYGWYAGFQNRNPTLQQKPTKLLSKATAKMTQDDVDDWFAKLNCFISEMNLSDKPDRIYYFDETGFGLSSKALEHALGSQDMKGALSQMNSNECEKQISVCVCANADGKLLPPCFLFNGTKPTSWDPFEGAPPLKSAVYFTESGCMTEAAYQDWFQNHFLQNIGNERPVVLLLDPHEGHIAFDLFKAAEESNIHLFRFLPNATNMLQPLDGGTFEHMKKSYWDHLRKWVACHPGETITERNVCRIIGNIWEDVERPNIIRESLASSGIFPVSRAAIIDENQTTMPSQIFREETSDNESVSAPDNESLSTSDNESVSTTDEESPETTVHMPTASDAQRAVSVHLTKTTTLPLVRTEKKARRRRLCNELPYDIARRTELNTVIENLSKSLSKARKELLLIQKMHLQRNQTESSRQTNASQECRCPICGKIYEESIQVGWVGCDKCNFWYHISCMPKKFVTSKMLKKKKWFCPNCRV